MDSKYSIGTANGGAGRNGSTPNGPSHKFSLKRKWNGSPQTPNGHHGQHAFKKQCNNGQQNGAHNGHQHSNKPNGATPGNKPQPTMSLMDQRRSLPVFQVRQKLMALVARHPTLIVLGETGSGKTTQIPQFLCDAGYANGTGHQIAVTQPRRVAAITLATRVAQEAGCRLGERVGYTVRFEDCSSPTQTKIKYVTDGALLREALGDRLLRRYSVIVLDEAHERTINTDVLFGIIKEAQRRRSERSLPGLKVVVMSATMDVDHFAKYFNNCECVYLAGRAHPVQVLHAKESQPEYTQACVSTLFEIHRQAQANHDVLIFLTGQEEIEHTAAQIRTITRSPDSTAPHSSKLPQLLVHTLYSQQTQQRQLDAFRPSARGTRKVVLCTNVAETSLTISGIRYVIDSGRVKRSSYAPLSGLETLRVERIAQDQAWQRTGRAGREAPGTCYRTYTMAEYAQAAPTTQPEILRASIVTTVLQLAALGIDCATFDFLDKPDASAVADAKRQLHALGALKSPVGEAELTELGRKMARFPLDARFSRCLLAAPEFGCTDAMLSIVAVLSGETVFVEPAAETEKRAQALAAHAKFSAAAGCGDHQTLLRVFRGFEAAGAAKVWCSGNWVSWRNLQYAREVRAQLRAICVQLGVKLDEEKKAAEATAAMKELRELNDETMCDEERVATETGSTAAAAAAEEAEDEAIRRCLLVGLGAQVAELTADGHTYKTRTVPGAGAAGRMKVKIHPSSRVGRGGAGSRPACVVYTELIATGQSYMRHVSAVEPEWLPEPALHVR